MLDFEVEHHTTYISYDIQSLIGELGGVIGMTLGLSGMSLADNLDSRFYWAIFLVKANSTLSVFEGSLAIKAFAVCIASVETTFTLVKSILHL